MTDVRLETLEAAKSKDEILSALRDLQRGEPFSENDLVFKYVSDPRWLMRHEALIALKNCRGPSLEQFLLDHGAKTQDRYELAYVNSALGHVGGSKSIPYLVAASSSKTEDVACSALAALAALGSRRELPVFLERLQSGRPPVKWYAMSGIEKHGDASAVNPVLKRVKAILSRERKTEQMPRSELVQAISYLWRHRSEDGLEEALRNLVSSKWDRLFASERNQVNEMMGAPHNRAVQPTARGYAPRRG